MFAIPKDLVIGFLKQNWVLMTVTDPNKAGFIQLVLIPKAKGNHNVPEPFDGLTSYITEWITSDADVLEGTDVCVAEERKYVTLKLAVKAGASEDVA